MARRSAIFTFGVASYALFLAVFLYTLGFVANAVVPKSVNSGVDPGAGSALALNLVLLALFALQHSVMARPAFKRAWTRVLPEAAERSAYVLASSVALALLWAGWQPMPAVVFTVEGPLARAALWSVCGLGAALVVASTFLIDHLDLFGLRQAWLALRDRPYAPRPFEATGLYRYVRHPLYTGWLLFFWATPDLTAGHLLLAGVLTIYILAAVAFEERDLEQAFGSDYRVWRARTPSFFPRFGAAARPAREAVESA